MRLPAFFIALLLFSTGLTASAGSLPLSTVFRGQSKFYALVAEAKQQNWRALPLGERIVAVAKSFLGTRYVNYTLEVDDHVEAPSANMDGLDCWTFFEISVGFARMLEIKSGNYAPSDLLAMIDVALVPQIAAIEQRIASRTIYHIPRERVSQIESRIRSGDVICITGRGPEGFTEHVGLAYRDGVGVVHFMHASKDERRVVIDVPIRQYVYRYHKFAGIMVVRPLDVSTPELSRMAEN